MMKNRSVAVWTFWFFSLFFSAVHLPAAAALTWNWGYGGTGFAASGSLTTTDTPDSSGYYTITSISGQRNGVAITGLQAAGTPIPGNEPFAVDNLIRESGMQLTGEGLGFSLADGTYANAFFADFLAVPGYLEFFSAPPFTSSGPEDSELPVQFHAAIVQNALPEPNALSLVAIGLFGLTLLRLKIMRSGRVKQ